MKWLELTLFILLIDEALKYSVLSNASKVEISQLTDRQPSSCSHVLQEMLNRESLLRFSMVQEIQSLMLDNVNFKKKDAMFTESLQSAITEIKTLRAENQKHGEQITKLEQTRVNLNNEITQLAANHVQSKNELLSLRMDQLLFSKAFNESLRNIQENQTIWENQLMDINTKLDMLTDRLASIINNMQMFGIENAKTKKELTNMNDDIHQIRNTVKNGSEELSYLKEDYLNFSNAVNERFEHLWYNQSVQDVQLSRIQSHIKSDHCFANVDLMFILDSSTSVGNTNYDKMKDFVKKCLHSADIDNGEVRVGLLSYSTKVKVEFQLNSYNSKTEVFNAVDALPWRYGSTNTADVLQTMHEEMFTETNGDRPGVPNICILMTDGVSNINYARTIPEAVTAREKGIHIYAIGIALYDLWEINGIASEPASLNAFAVESFDELEGIVEKIYEAPCPATTT